MIKALKYPKSQNRNGALTVIGNLKIDKTSTIPHIIELLCDNNSEVRAEASSLLAQIGPDASDIQEAIPQLILLTHAENFQVAFNARRALNEIVPDEVEQVNALLDTFKDGQRDYLTRNKAFNVIEQMADDDHEKAISALKQIDIVNDLLLDIVNNNQKDFLVRKHAFDRIKQMSEVNEKAKLALKEIDGGLKEMFAVRPEWSGVWINRRNANPATHKITDYISSLDIAGEAGRVQWQDIELSPGEFDFSEIHQSLTRARDNNYYYYFVFWTGPSSPGWIYDKGVPRVKTDDAHHMQFFDQFPYYLNEDYKKYIKRFMSEMAKYIADLPKDLREKLAFIQPGLGATGDRQLYKGSPIDSQYEVSSDEYLDFMKEMTLILTNEFNKYPETEDIIFLWNVDDYDGSDPSDLIGISDRLRGERLYAEWMHKNFNTNIRKQQFTIAIGYMDPEEKSQDERQRAAFFGYDTGVPQFVRGEFNDTRWANTPLAQVSLPWYYYWTSISSVDRGLDAWEVIWEGIEYVEAIKFSTRYSFYKEAATSPVAFIALRDVLDYSDAERFPASQYGSVNRNNEARINAILEEYKDYGARNDDTAAVIEHSRHRYLLDSKGLNDVVWNVIARNYRRFITQYNPNETSVGLWRVGSKDDPYGRFARSFEHASGKNAMYFNLDEDFFGGSPLNGEYPVEIKVIYYDEGYGSWELRYDAVDDPDKTAYKVTNTGTDTWKEKTVTLDDAYFGNRGPNHTDFYLKNADEEDNVFHMVEIEKKP